MPTSVGSAYLDIQASTIKALAALRTFATQGLQVLEPLGRPLDLTVNTQQVTAGLGAVQRETQATLTGMQQQIGSLFTGLSGEAASSARASAAAIASGLREEESAQRTAAQNYRQTLALNLRLAQENARSEAAAVRGAAQQMTVAQRQAAQEYRQNLQLNLRLKTDQLRQEQAADRQAGQQYRQTLQLNARIAQRAVQEQTQANRQAIDGLILEYQKVRTAADRAFAQAHTWTENRDASRQYMTAMEGVEHELERVRQQAGLTESQLTRLSRLEATIVRQQNTLEGRVNPLGLSGNISAALSAFQGLAPVLGSLGPSLGAAAAPLQMLSGGFGNLKALLNPVALGIGAVVVAVGALAVGLAHAVGDASAFQQQMAGIRSTTEAGAQENDALGRSLLGLTRQLPVTSEQMTGIARNAVLFGVRGNDSVLNFTKTIAQLGVVTRDNNKSFTDLGQLSENLAKFLNETGSTAATFNTDLKGVATTLAVVDQNTASTITQTLDLAKYMASGSVTLGLTRGQIIGLSGALSGLGANSEAGGGSVIRLLTKMRAAADGAGKNAAQTSQVYERLMGVNAEAFKQLALHSPADALKRLSDGLLQVHNQGGAVDAVLTALGVTNIRDIRLLDQLTVGNGNVTKSFHAVLDAMNGKVTLDQKAKVATDDLRDSQKLLSNGLHELSTTVGLPLLKPLQGFVDVLTSGVHAVTDMVSAAQSGQGAMGQLGQAFGQVWTAAQQALTPLWTIVQTVFRGVAALWGSVLWPVLQVLIQVWTTIQTAVQTALTIVFNVVLGVFQGILSFVGSFVPGFAGHMGGVKLSLAGVAQAFAEWAGAARAYLVAGGKIAGQLPPLFQAVGASIGGVFQGIGKIFEGFGLLAYDRLVRPLLPVMGAIRSSFVGVANTIGDVVGGILDFVGREFAPLADFLKSIGMDIGGALAGVVSAAGAKLRVLIGGAADGFQQQANAQAAAAKQAATGSSQALTLIQSGVQQVGSSVKGAGQAVTQFGQGASAAFGQVRTDLRATAAQAQQTAAAIKGIGTGGGASSATSLARPPIDLTGLGGGKPRKVRAAPITASDMADLDGYKKSLKGMTDAQLRDAEATAKATNNKRHMSAILEELTRRQNAHTKGVHTSGIALDDYRSKLTGMTDAQLVQAAAQARAQNNTSEYNAVLAEQKRRHEAAAKGAHTQGIALDDLRTSLKGKTDAELVSLATSARARKDTGAYNAILAEQRARHEAAATAAKKHAGEMQKAATQAKTDAASARTLNTEISQLNDRFRVQAQQGTVTAAGLLSYHQQLDRLHERLTKLPEPLRATGRGLIEQGYALVKTGQGVADYNSSIDKLRVGVKEWSYAELEAARARVVGADGDRKKLAILDAEIAKRRVLTQTQVDTADTQSQRDQSKADLDQLQSEYEGKKAAAKEDAAQLLQIEQDYGDRLRVLKDQQAQDQAADETRAVNEKYGRLLALAGISDTARRKLEADQAAELTAIQTRLTSALAQDLTTRNNALQEAQTNFGKVQAQVDAAHTESQRDQSRANLEQLQSEYDGRKDAAKGNLGQLVQIEAEYGDRLRLLKDQQAQDQATDETRAVSEKYGKLLALDGLSADARRTLQADQAKELAAIQTQLTGTLARDLADRNTDSQQAQQNYDDALSRMDRESRDILRANQLKDLEAQTEALEAQQQGELDDETLTAVQKLAIQTRYQPLLLAQKQREADAARLIQVDAENDRYTDQLEAARQDGTLAARQETLLQVHTSNLALIQRESDASVRDYTLGVKRETGRLVLAAQRETSEQLKGEADKNTADLLQSLDTMDGAQRLAAKSTLDTWRATYAALGKAGEAAVAQIDEALSRLKKSNGELLRDAGKLVATNPDQVSRDGALSLNAVGRPDDAQSASDKAAAQFDALRDTYRKKLAELAVPLALFSAIQDKDLTPDQRQVQAGLLATYQLYDGLLTNVTLAAGDAGTKAADAFVLAQQDKAADGALALAEAQYKLAELEKKDGSPAYIAGLNAALSYWKARLTGLTAGTPEYLDALTRVTDLETKVGEVGKKSTSALGDMLSEASKLMGSNSPVQGSITAGLDGLAAYFNTEGGGAKAIYAGVSAWLGGMVAVFKTGDEDMDRVTQTFVSGIQSVLGQLATGNWMGAIISGVTTVVSSIVDIFTGGANSARKAADQISEATKDIKIFDVSKYAQVVSADGFFGWLGFKKSQIDSESVAIAKTLGDTLSSAISTGMLDGIKAGKSSFSDLGIDVRKSLSEQILQGLIDGFLKSAVFAATVQPFLDEYIAAMKSGNSQALAQAASDLQGAIGTANGQLADFYQNVLVPTATQLGVYGSDSSSSSSGTAASDLGLVGTVPDAVVQGVTTSNQALTTTVSQLASTVTNLQAAVDTLTSQGIPLDIALSKQADTVRYQSSTGALRSNL